MFGKKNQPPIKSLIAQGSTIEGNLKFAEGLRVDGDIVGDIFASPGSPSILVVSESASVTGPQLAGPVSTCIARSKAGTICSGRIMRSK